jgi:hypothetical protein
VLPPIRGTTVKQIYSRTSRSARRIGDEGG